MVVMRYFVILGSKRRPFINTRVGKKEKNPFGKPQVKVDFACVYNL